MYIVLVYGWIGVFAETAVYKNVRGAKNVRYAAIFERDEKENEGEK
jgi:hypothetical protein